ncbi:MAG: NAD(P)-dependent oxidoreductase [Paracoccaceae bacterium]
MTTLAIFGAGGATGMKTVRQAISRGHRVIAIEIEEDPSLSALDGVELRTADVMNDDIGPVLDGADAVISCLGVGGKISTLMNPPPLYSQGVRQIVAGMKDTGLTRLVVMSATFVAAKDRGPIWFRFPAMAALDRVLDDMTEMETVLRGTDGIDWTAVRPGWLMEGDLTADYHVQADVIPEDHIRTRMADVAHFMLNLVEGTEWARQTPALSRREHESATSIDKVVADMVA